MSSSSDLEVNIHVNADGVETFDQVAQGEQQVADASTGANVAGENWGQLGTTFGRVGVLGVVAMDRLAIAQNAVENASIRQELAQQRLDDAIAKSGPNSEAARKAKQELEIATRGVEIATQREEVRTLIMAGVVIPQMIRGVYNLLPALTGWAYNNGLVTMSTVELTNAQRALLATSIIGIPLLLAGLAFTGAIGAGGGGSPNVNVYGDVNMPSATGPGGFGTSTADWARTVR